MKLQHNEHGIASCRAQYVALVLSALTSVGSLAQSVDERLGLPTEIRDAQPPAVRLSALGEKLFFDKRFSADGSVSCATCHQPSRAFTDGLPKARGLAGQVGTRNAPSLYNASLVDNQFWDGRQRSLEKQALEPFVNPVEHGLHDYGALLTIIRRDSAYARDFENVFGISRTAIDVQKIANALAAFERTLAFGNSAFDRYYYGHDTGALSLEAMRGLVLFSGRAQCTSCHSIGPKGAAFTDGQFHSLHIGIPRIEKRLPDLGQRVVRLKSEGRSVAEIVLSDADIAELGRFVVTLDPSDIGKFRTPSLRNVALTAPYMHDGSIGTLEAAIDQEIYYRTAQSGQPLILTPQEKADLVAFLHSLTSQRALLPPSALHDYSVKRGPDNTRSKHAMR